MAAKGSPAFVDPALAALCSLPGGCVKMPPLCGLQELFFMHCPFCGAHDTKVVDSRLVTNGDQVRRRRECISCSERFTTFEVAELQLPRLIKQDGSRQPFDENKLRAGMMRALEK